MTKQEVSKMLDLSQKTIEKLFYEKMKQKTLGSVEQSFDYQFSDDWMFDFLKQRTKIACAKPLCL